MAQIYFYAQQKDLITPVLVDSYVFTLTESLHGHLQEKKLLRKWKI